ncbi:MAG: glycosyltransferase family 4 protein [Pseudomonadota bacterium]|nr:glycosyltransferase family 4 protein [Pseudomonadota bacterium]
MDLFLSALRSFSDEIEVAYFAREDEIAALGLLAPHEAALSASWGLPVRLNPTPIRRRAKTAWNHYGAGALSVWQQDDYCDFAGPEQSARLAESLARGPDLVLASGLLAMGAFMRVGVRPTRLFLDLENIEHKTRLRATLAPPFWPGKVLYATHIPSILLAERRATKMAEATFVCSELDRRYLRRLGMGRNVEVVPNGLPVPPSPAPLAPDPTVLFLGTYGYPPNCDAADRLIKRIWPLVRERMPEARLLIAGKDPERIASFKSVPPGVTFTGFVEDLDRLYAEARVVACPIMVGGGTRVKLVEAASYGRPMVSTRVGAEGLGFEDGREILLRDDAASFAEACVMLLRDEAACARLGEAARAKMKARYSAAEAAARIAQVMQGRRA